LPFQALVTISGNVTQITDIFCLRFDSAKMGQIVSFLFWASFCRNRSMQQKLNVFAISLPIQIARYPKYASGPPDKLRFL
jgi:hypothetical protein